MLNTPNVYNGMFRGEVVSNLDPQYKGRIKVFVHGVYPDEYKANSDVIPWAEPAMPLFGGAYASSSGTVPETGTTSSPHVGASVWVFFEAGDYLKPIYCFGIQAGSGWLSQHENQHCIKTDNVSLVIDENTDHPKSTTKYSTNNANQSVVANDVIDNVGARVQLKVKGNVDIVIEGDLNFKVTGNTYREYGGNVYDTYLGAHYVKQTGSLYSIRDGSSYISNAKISSNIYQDKVSYIHGGDTTFDVAGNLTSNITGNRRVYIGGTDVLQSINKSEIILGSNSISTIGDYMQSTSGTHSIMVQGDRFDTTTASVTGSGSHTITCASFNLYTGMESRYTIMSSLYTVLNSTYSISNSTVSVMNSLYTVLNTSIKVQELQLVAAVKTFGFTSVRTFYQNEYLIEAVVTPPNPSTG